ncbi:MAG: hypothetical protein ABI396_15635 [Ktedonobacteraceae bacterium]
MARTPLEIIQQYIDQFEQDLTTPAVQQDTEQKASLEAKIHLLETLKVDIELEVEKDVQAAESLSSAAPEILEDEV